MFVRPTPPADLEPKDWDVSLQDIFVETQQKIHQWYQDNNLHCTELALMDADGDGKGQPLLVVPEAAAAAPSASAVGLQGIETGMPLPVDLETSDAKNAKAIYFHVKRENTKWAPNN